MASEAELACTYSALILADDDVPITAEKLQTLIKAANVDVEPFWPTLFARALSDISIKDLISNVGSAAAAAPAGGAGGAPAAAEEAKEEKKEEKKEESEESDDDMGFGLFD
uniref:Large ribosomal subunit protein P1 n=1 Tax=Sipunculus nudus TaxID=6446 RepID=A8U9Y9_SIPNU|nr:putative ribosomal protein P1 [Sipunculus nudus]